MTRWSQIEKKQVGNPQIDSFLRDIVAVYMKHQMCIMHEDTHGAFIIEPMHQEGVNWIRDAHDNVGRKNGPSPSARVK
jgi:hypothetical protein